MSTDYWSIIENLPDAFAYHQIIKNSNGFPEDYIFVKVNKAFTEMFELSKDNVLGKRITEIYPDIKESSFDWIGTFGKVALSGGNIRFEHYYEPLDCWYEITAHSCEPGCFSVFFREIIDKKKKQEIVEAHQRMLTVLDSVDAFIYVADLKTYEILFINRYGRNLFGSIAGRKCWQVIQEGQTGPCEFCKNDKLTGSSGQPTGVYHWVLRNTKNGRWYDCRDIALKWIDGRMVKLEISTDITKYKQMQEELQKDRNKLATILENILDTIPDIIFYKDIHGNYLGCNTEFAMHVGYGKEDIIGKTDYELYSKEEADAFRKNDQRVLDLGAKCQNEEWISYPDGRKILIDTLITPYYDSDGKIIGILGISRDITERKQTENALSESEKKLSIIFNSCRDDMFIIDTKGKIIELNKSACEHLGYSREELLDKSLFNFVSPEYSNLAFKRIEKILSSGYYVFESANMNRDGKVIPVEVNATAIEYEGKRVILSITRDISDRKRDEEALNRIYNELQKSEENYRFLVENTHDLIYSLDRESRHTAVNQSVCRALGIKAQEIIGKNHRELGFPKDVVSVWVEMHQKVFNTGEVIETETTTQMPDGTVRTYELVLMPVFDENGIVTSIRGTSRDISDRKKMEQEIFKADKLESIGILAGGIAHDFNNYLANLLGNISLAKLYKTDSDKILEKLENIEKATIRAKDLSYQLFTFAIGGAPVKKEVSINNSIVDNVKFTLSGSNVRCKFMISDDLNLVEIDEGQFSQVLNNIVINAIQAIPDGGEIEVAAENITIEDERQDYCVMLPEGTYIRISIKDEGIGIPEKHLLKIFDPFFTTKYKGSGLGLATSYSIIKNHGGYLTVQSKLGVGTTFFIFLPASTQDGLSITESEKILYGTGKIMIMDDEEDVLKVTGEMLSTLGYEVSLARDGKEAIGIYVNALKKGRPFDLVIMDLTIPGGMGGKDTIIKLLKKDHNAKAIVYSGYSKDPVMANFKDYGFKGVMKKPFSIEELSKIIHEIMS